MGLPGAGKTTLANELKNQLEQLNKTVTWLNADIIREQFNDWDFTPEGRIRQAQRMSDLAQVSKTDFVLCDFVAALPEQRKIFSADYVIWVDTITEGRFKDTNAVFINPDFYNIRVTEQDAIRWAKLISDNITNQQSL